MHCTCRQVLRWNAKLETVHVLYGIDDCSIYFALRLIVIALFVYPFEFIQTYACICFHIAEITLNIYILARQFKTNHTTYLTICLSAPIPPSRKLSER